MMYVFIMVTLEHLGSDIYHFVSVSITITRAMRLVFSDLCNHFFLLNRTPKCSSDCFVFKTNMGINVGLNSFLKLQPPLILFFALEQCLQLFHLDSTLSAGV